MNRQMDPISVNAKDWRSCGDKWFDEWVPEAVNVDISSTSRFDVFIIHMNCLCLWCTGVMRVELPLFLERKTFILLNMPGLS